MAEGWIMLHRSIFDNSLYLSEKFTRSQAWIDLLLLANHKEIFYFKRGNKVTVKRGQVARGIKHLAERWQWSRTKVSEFLDLLESEKQITQKRTNVITTITITNYEKYQSQTPENDSNNIGSRNKNKDTSDSRIDTKTTLNRNQNRHENDTNNNVKNDNNVNNPPGFGKNSEIDFCNIRFDLWKKDTSKFINSVREAIGPDVRLMDFNVEVNTLKDPESKTIIKDPEAFFKSKIINLLTEHHK